MDPYWQEGFGDTAIEYRPDLANEMLDGLGLDKRNGQGYRLLPNGEVLDLTIECYPRETGSAVIEFYSMVAEYWEDVGIKTAAKEIARELWTERCLAGEVEIPGYTTVGVAWDINQNWYIPIQHNCWWAPLYGLWYTSGGESGEEPTPIIKQLQELGEQMRAETDPDKRLQIGTEILRIHDENIWNVGILKVPFQPVIVNARMRNYLEEGVQDYRHLHEAQTWPEQLFYVDGRRK